MPFDDYIPRLVDKVTAVQEEVARIHMAHQQLALLKSVVPKAGEVLKTNSDYTTQADIDSEKFIRSALLEALPGASFLGEETDESKTHSRYTWIVDPIDGTAVFTLGGEYYSSSIALIDKDSGISGQVVLGSVYQSVTGRQFVKARKSLLVREVINLPDNSEYLLERRLRSSKSENFSEFMGCSFGPARYYDVHPKIKKMLEGVFDPVEVSELGRVYAPINAKPASGSSALFCCDIADGNRHFALLFFQKAWDLAVGALYAKQAGCPVVVFDDAGRITDDDLERVIVGCDKKSLVSVGVFANDFVKDDILKRFYRGD